MSLAVKLDGRPEALAVDTQGGVRKLSAIARDFALLLGLALTSGLATGLGLMLAVFALT